jgi:hypothetical protein
MIQPHKSECRGGARQTANQSTNGLDFATGTSNSKAISTLFAELALSGYEVRAMQAGGYVAANHFISRRCETLEDLYALAQEVGAAE